MHVKEGMDALVVKNQISPLSLAGFLLSSQKPVSQVFVCGEEYIYILPGQGTKLI